MPFNVVSNLVTLLRWRYGRGVCTGTNFTVPFLSAEAGKVLSENKIQSQSWIIYECLFPQGLSPLTRKHSQAIQPPSTLIYLANIQGEEIRGSLWLTMAHNGLNLNGPGYRLQCPNLFLLCIILKQHSWQSHPYHHLPSPFSAHQQLHKESSRAWVSVQALASGATRAGVGRMNSESQ